MGLYKSIFFSSPLFCSQFQAHFLIPKRNYQMIEQQQFSLWRFLRPISFATREKGNVYSFVYFLLCDEFVCVRFSLASFSLGSNVNGHGLLSLLVELLADHCVIPRLDVQISL